VPKSKGCTKLSLSVFMRDSPHINTMAGYCCYSRRQPLAPPTPLLLAPLRPVSSLSPPVPSALVMIVSSRTPPPLPFLSAITPTGSVPRSPSASSLDTIQFSLCLLRRARRPTGSSMLPPAAATAPWEPALFRRCKNLLYTVVLLFL
jgi:hypothetical protein